MVSVACWTGAETKALRKAMRLSIRAFAAYLGIDARTVNKWEARHTTITLRPHTQALMDTALARVPEEVRTRFSHTVSSARQEEHGNAVQRAAVAHDAYTESAPRADFRTPLPGNDGSDFLLTELGFALPDPVGVLDPDERERLSLAAVQPCRTDSAALEALAAVLFAVRQLEDETGAAAVLPIVEQQRILADRLAAGVPVQERPAAVGLSSEMHQYLGWLSIPLGWRPTTRSDCPPR